MHRDAVKDAVTIASIVAAENRKRKHAESNVALLTESVDLLKNAGEDEEGMCLV